MIHSSNLVWLIVYLREFFRFYYSGAFFFNSGQLITIFEDLESAVKKKTRLIFFLQEMNIFKLKDHVFYTSKK